MEINETSLKVALLVRQHHLFQTLLFLLREYAPTVVLQLRGILKSKADRFICLGKPSESQKEEKTPFNASNWFKQRLAKGSSGAHPNLPPPGHPAPPASLLRTTSNLSLPPVPPAAGTSDEMKVNVLTFFLYRPFGCSCSIPGRTNTSTCSCRRLGSSDSCISNHYRSLWRWKSVLDEHTPTNNAERRSYILTSIR